MIDRFALTDSSVRIVAAPMAGGPSTCRHMNLLSETGYRLWRRPSCARRAEPLAGRVYCGGLPAHAGRSRPNTCAERPGAACTYPRSDSMYRLTIVCRNE